MELTVGSHHHSGLDVVCEVEHYQHFANAIELKNIPYRLVQSGMELLGEATLQKMKRKS